MEAETEVLTDRALSESMDESIRDTLRDITSRNADAFKDDTKPEATEAVPAVEAEAPAKPAAEEKPRDAEGKFVKGEQKRHKPAATEPAAAAKPDTPEKPIAAPGPEQAAAAPAEEPLKFGKVEVDLARPPSSWKPAAKAAWAALPEVVKQDIYRRETDFSNTVLNGPLKETADFGREVKSVIEPYRMLIEAEGGTPARAIADTMRTAALFRVGTPQQKLQALHQIDKQFGCGLEADFQRAVQAEVTRITGGHPQVGQPAAQPAIIQDPRYDALEAQFKQVTGALQAQERERSAAQEKSSMEAVQAFWSAKDAQGAPKYPFIDNVLDDMMQRVPLLRRQNPSQDHQTVLQQAYEAAVWANPETRAVLIAATQAPAVAAAETQRKVAEAKLASAGNVPKRGALPATGAAPDLDQVIRDTGRKLGMF